MFYNETLIICEYITLLVYQKRIPIIGIITCRAKLLKCDWLMRRAFFLNSGQKLLDPDWLRHFILSIRTKYQKYTQQDACTGVHSACRREENGHNLDICVLRRLRLRQGQMQEFLGLKGGGGVLICKYGI